MVSLWRVFTASFSEPLFVFTAFLKQTRAYIGDEAYSVPRELTGGKCFQQDSRMV